jgi:hypothetical protein
VTLPIRFNENPIRLVTQSLLADKHRGNILKFSFCKLVVFSPELFYTLWLYLCQGEEIFVRYGYELDYCPEWYLEAWEKGKSTTYIFFTVFKTIFNPNVHLYMEELNSEGPKLALFLAPTKPLQSYG